MSAETDWEALRRDYETHSIPTKDIVQKFEISADRIYRRAVLDGWLRRPAKVGRIRAVLPLEAVPQVESGHSLPSATLPPIPASHAEATDFADLKPLKPIAKRRAILNRLTNVIDTKLTLLERRFERELAGASDGGKALSAADFERDTRNIGLLIKNLEQVTDFDHAHSLGKRALGGSGGLHGAAAKSANLAAATLADEADRLRRELAERLQRLVDPVG